MALRLKNKELLALMRDFYVLTGFRIVLFDEHYKEILSYPKEGTPFCSRMREDPDFYQKCQESDRASFARCRASHALTISQCHAGLLEATAPLTDGGRSIGYIMFGQIADRQEKEAFLSSLATYCAGFSGGDKLDDILPKIKYKERRQVAAAAGILEACTSYILLKEMVRPTEEAVFRDLNAFIEANLCAPLNVDVLCRALGIGRSRLYELVRPYVSGGVAQYIREKRIAAAKQMLSATTLSVTTIADRVGFADYNYFIRVFRQYCGCTPKTFRKRQENAAG